MKSAASVRIELSRSPLAGAFIAVKHLATATLLAWLPIDASLRAPGLSSPVPKRYGPFAARRCAT